MLTPWRRTGQGIVASIFASMRLIGRHTGQQLGQFAIGRCSAKESRMVLLLFPKAGGRADTIRAAKIAGLKMWKPYGLTTV